MKRQVPVLDARGRPTRYSTELSTPRDLAAVLMGVQEQPRGSLPQVGCCGRPNLTPTRTPTAPYRPSTPPICPAPAPPPPPLATRQRWQ